MDTRNGTIYPSREAAEAAGVPEEYLVTGTRRALEKLARRLKFTKGSFKPEFPGAKAVVERMRETE